MEVHLPLPHQHQQEEDLTTITIITTMEDQVAAAPQLEVEITTIITTMEALAAVARLEVETTTTITMAKNENMTSSRISFNYLLYCVFMLFQLIQ